MDISQGGSGPLWGQMTAATASAGHSFPSALSGPRGAMDQSTLRLRGSNQPPPSPGNLRPSGTDPCRSAHRLAASSSHAAPHRRIRALTSGAANPALPPQRRARRGRGVDNPPFSDRVEHSMCRFAEAGIRLRDCNRSFPTGYGAFRSAMPERRPLLKGRHPAMALRGPAGPGPPERPVRTGRSRTTRSPCGRRELADFEMRRDHLQTELNAPCGPCVPTAIQAPPRSCRTAAPTPFPRRREV
jgi:hypothetical protein